MRQFLLMFILGLGLMFFPQNIFAYEGEDNVEMDHMEFSQVMGEAPQQMQADSAVEEVGNPFCPVSGEKIPVPGEKGDMGEAIKYEYNGKVYNLCCPMCIKDFKKDPEKFSKKAEEQMIGEKSAN